MSTLIIHTQAADRRAALITSATDATPVTTDPSWVLGDAQPLTLIYSDGTAAAPWDGDATYTCTVALGQPSPIGDPLTTATLTAGGSTGSGWTGSIALNGSTLIERVKYLHGQSHRRGIVRLTLQVRVTAPSGYTVSYALIPIELNTRVMSS